MKDYLIVGDVHGCGHELKILLEEYKKDHIVVLVGDMFDRALDGVLVWELIHEHNMICIRGNHEAKMLKYLLGERDYIPAHYHYFLSKFSKKYKIKDLTDFLYDLPMTYKIDDSHIVTHAGVLLETPLEEDISANIYGKCKVNKLSEYVEDKIRWSDKYKEEIVVYYGHIARDKVIMGNSYSKNINSYCLDTAAYYGVNLTAIEHSSKNIYQIKTKDYFNEFKKMNMIIDKNIKYL